MSSLLPDLTTGIHPEPPCILSPEPQLLDQFDSLSDSLLLLIINNLTGVKALARCSYISRRFHSLVPQVQNVVVRVDCVISDDDPFSSSNSSDKSRSISTLFRILIGGIFKPIQALG
ncbi:putative F-box-like domain superfamily protein [Helianthus anomalus]